MFREIHALGERTAAAGPSEVVQTLEGAQQRSCAPQRGNACDMMGPRLRAMVLARFGPSPGEPLAGAHSAGRRG